MIAIGKHGVALKILTGLVLIILFTILAGIVAIFSFKEASRAFTQVTSTQMTMLADAATLRQHSQALAALAPSLFVRDLNDGSLLDFTTKAYNQQTELQAVIGALAGQIDDKEGIALINQTASALFENADALSTAIYFKAARLAGIDRSIAELAAIRTDARRALAEESMADPAMAEASFGKWISWLDMFSSTVLKSLATKDQSSLPGLNTDIGWVLAEAEAASRAPAKDSQTLLALHVRLARIARGPESLISERQQLLAVQKEIEDLFQKNENISKHLSTIVDRVVTGVREDAAERNQSLSTTLADRSRLLLILGGLGVLGALAIGAFIQMSVIGRLGRLRKAMIGGYSEDEARSLTNGKDEIAEMARAVVDHVAELDRRDADIKRSDLRLTGAIETMPDGFSLYDADDKLVVCNSRYGQLLYPGLESFVQPGQPFESIVRKAVEHGLIRVADGNVNKWVAKRIEAHRNAGSITTQQRADGAWIEIRERRAESGDIVAIYTDITERKAFEAELVKARQHAENARETAEEKNRMLERVSSKLSKYLSPQLYATIFTGKHDVAISSARKKLTIMFADIADFTETTDNLESEELTALLNHYLTEMAKIALDHGATIDKYIGDAIMVFLGDPESRGIKEDAVACVTMAVAMQRRLHELKDVWRARGIERPFQMRVGINTGFCTVGNFGSEDRMDYTIIGSEVNLAARLQAQAERNGILLAHETCALVKDVFATEEQKPITVKGFAEAVRVHRVLGIHDGSNDTDGIIQAKTPGAEIYVDLAKLSPEQSANLRSLAEKLLARLPS